MSSNFKNNNHPFENGAYYENNFNTDSIQFNKLQERSTMEYEEPIYTEPVDYRYLYSYEEPPMPMLPPQPLPSLEQYQMMMLPPPPPPPMAMATYPVIPYQRARHSQPSNRMRSVSTMRLIRTSSLPLNQFSTGRDLNRRRITVDLNGDLSMMTTNWTMEEFQNKRRLVKFNWQQQDNEIKLTFEPVSERLYNPDMTIVSCIYDSQENQFFFTSVDFINFFEKLANSHFNIEEKNRIRRNLQSLKPLTINKLYQKELFILIMSFTSPKPRNIEKKVKIFHWNCFVRLLNKLILKYSFDLAYDDMDNLDSQDFKNYYL